jgi:hypothetical protein
VDRIWIDDQPLATVIPWAHDLIRRGEFDRIGEHRFASTNEASRLVRDDRWRRAGVTDDGRILLWRWRRHNPDQIKDPDHMHVPVSDGWS